MLVRLKYKVLLIIITVLFVGFGNAQTQEKLAQAKIKTLNTLISKVEKQGKDVLKEKMTVRTAEVFLEFANWDEKNVSMNTELFKLVSNYKDKATETATELPNFERTDVIKMLDEAIEYITLLKDGKVNRKEIPNVDWKKVNVEKAQITFNNRPVFLADYTWKPETKKLEEFYGSLDGFYISPAQIINASGEVNENILSNLNSKPSVTPGFVFINNKGVPKWATTKYGDGFTKFQGPPFFDYDIDNPGAKEMMSFLIKETVPKMAGNKYTDLGYMLCNEPRWINYKNGNKKVWYNSEVSSYTIEKFKAWLKEKHSSIANLNKIWKTNYTSFNEVTIENPIDVALQGTPQWYDWSTFNDARVLEWFTWMKSEIRKYDPSAKSQLKIMPSFFTDNDPCTGIDLEALAELSEINGNDIAAHYNYTRNGKMGWEDDYIFGWRELFLGYDFLKSVQPNQINFNSESHLLSTSHTRDLYMNPKYARAVYWAATILGMNASQTWYWPRKADGSLKENFSDNAYGGSNNQQPRVTNELHATIMDLNSYSEEIAAMQNQRKPIRIFYSKTSAYNKGEYMDDLFELYESLNFEGIPLGFATKNIIAKQDPSNWDVVLVQKTEQVTQDELEQLQSYLDKGGIVIVDKVSLKFNEYGIALPDLTQSKGTLIIVDLLEDMKLKALQIVEQKNNVPEITIIEENETDINGCTWKCVKNEKGNNVLSIINLGKTNATLNIQFRNSKNETTCFDLLNGISISSQPTLKPYEVLFVEVKNEK
ncbi:beta-galactosidase [Mariniflexile fucanivorans]|uniref:Beta-galactosidase n=1 Tax=Mariniflexile fucanivorans TaxID=264023 RepID=A0A4R1RKY4_9FLAO|nr:beta-galactosidase [Mariniflexile fucanivorans]